MKNIIWEFIKKHLQTVLIIILCILLVSIYSIKQNQVARFAAKVATLQADYDAMNNDRKQLEIERDKLILEGLKQQRRIDSISNVLTVKKKELSDLIKQHAQEIAELTNVPPDTVYLRLTDIYPNYDTEPLKYPFAASQITQIYSTALSYPRLQQEYSLQTNILSSCNDLNVKYKESESMLKAQIDNCLKDVGIANSQIDNRNTVIDSYIKKDKRSSFWKKTLSIAGGVGWLIAIIK